MIKQHAIAAITTAFLMPSQLFASPDPFMGEGKQNYINRCAANASAPELSQRQRVQLCTCVANGLEKEYPNALRQISPSDSIATAQRKLDATGQRVAMKCLGSITL